MLLILDLTIVELIEKHWLSVRSSKVCKANELCKLSTILDYFIEHSTFMNLPNCGAKSDTELAIEKCRLSLIVLTLLLCYCRYFM